MTAHAYKCFMILDIRYTDFSRDIDLTIFVRKPTIRVPTGPTQTGFYSLAILDRAIKHFTGDLRFCFRIHIFFVSYVIIN